MLPAIVPCPLGGQREVKKKQHFPAVQGGVQEGGICKGDRIKEEDGSQQEQRERGNSGSHVIGLFTFSMTSGAGAPPSARVLMVPTHLRLPCRLRAAVPCGAVRQLVLQCHEQAVPKEQSMHGALDTLGGLTTGLRSRSVS